MLTDTELIKKALEARKYAYSPYSKFCVGAALLCAGNEVYTGCNIENASYSATNCAERTAFFKAVSDGKKDFVKIVVAGGPAEMTDDTGQLCAPCGVCRQVMAEFCDSESFEVIIASGVGHYKSYKLKELLPLSFTEQNLKK